jgi:hypothetical protein
MQVMQQQMAMMQQQIQQQQMMLRSQGQGGMQQMHAPMSSPQQPMGMMPQQGGVGRLGGPIDLSAEPARDGAFGFMGGTGPADAFDFVGDEVKKNKKSI